MEDKIITISEKELEELIEQTVEIVANDLSKNSEDSYDRKMLVSMIGYAIACKFMININEYYEKQQEPKCVVVFNENN